jgi:peptide deformylase
MIKSVVEWPDPVLLTPTQPWNFDQPQLDGVELEQDLVDTMLDQQALGLAANQIGLGVSVFAMHLRENDQCIVLYNPQIVTTSTETWNHSEGCLSFPRIQLEVERPAEVVCRWQNRDGSTEQREFTGWDAKCFQHELEHLQGQVFKQHVSELKYQQAVKRSRR